MSLAALAPRYFRPIVCPGPRLPAPAPAEHAECRPADGRRLHPATVHQRQPGRARSALRGGGLAVRSWACGCAACRAWWRAPAVLLAGMQLIQHSHVSFFGEPLAAPDIVSLFADFAEVRETGWASLPTTGTCCPRCCCPTACCWPCTWLPRHVRLPQSRWAPLIIVLVLAAKPWRATTATTARSSPGRPQRPATTASTPSPSMRRAPGLPPGRDAAQGRRSCPTGSPLVASGAKARLGGGGGFAAHRPPGLPGHERDTARPSSRLQVEGELLARPGIAQGGHRRSACRCCST